MTIANQKIWRVVDIDGHVMQSGLTQPEADQLTCDLIDAGLDAWTQRED